MTFSNGQDGHFVYAIEDPPGTRQTPTIALPFLQESIQDQGSQPLWHEGIIKGRGTHHGAGRTKSDIRGQVRVPLIADGIGGLLRAAFGAVSTAGSGPFAHTFTRGPLAHFSAQVGWDDNAGTAFRKDLVGGLVDGWSLDLAANQNPALQFDVTGQSLAADAHPAIEPTYGTLSYFEFSDAVVKVDGGDGICFDTISLNGANGLYQSPAICPSNPRATVYEDSGMLEVSGTIGRDFDAWTYHNKFVAGTEATIGIKLTAGVAAVLEIALNVLFTGETPQVSGRERIKSGIPFVATSAISDADACTVTLTNSDSSV